jgi:uncharacterized integral membrane protein (TIGR00697 family)
MSRVLTLMKEYFSLSTGVKGSRLFVFFAGMYCILLIMSNILAGAKLVQLFGFLTIAGGTVLFPLSYIINDLLSEVYGLKRTRIVLLTGIAGLMIASAFTILVQRLNPAPIWNNQVEYDKILGQFMRINCASFVAIFVGSYTNAWVVEKMKYMGDHWLATGARFIASTALAEALDTVLFLGIAFTGIMPNDVLLTAMLSQWVFKTLWEAIALPITLPLVQMLKKFENRPSND